MRVGTQNPRFCVWLAFISHFQTRDARGVDHRTKVTKTCSRVTRRAFCSVFLRPSWVDVSGGLQRMWGGFQWQAQSTIVSGVQRWTGSPDIVIDRRWRTWVAGVRMQVREGAAAVQRCPSAKVRPGLDKLAFHPLNVTYPARLNTVIFVPLAKESSRATLWSAENRCMLLRLTPSSLCYTVTGLGNDELPVHSNTKLHIDSQNFGGLSFSYDLLFFYTSD